METTGDRPTRVLFVCTHNSARSQMAEGMVRAWGGDRFEAFSAGTEASHVRPEAIAVMREIGIDISGHTSKTILPFLGEAFAWVITVCDAAKESCPVIPGADPAGALEHRRPVGASRATRRSASRRFERPATSSATASTCSCWPPAARTSRSRLRLASAAEPPAATLAR